MAPAAKAPAAKAKATAADKPEAATGATVETPAPVQPVGFKTTSETSGPQCAQETSTVVAVKSWTELMEPNAQCDPCDKYATELAQSVRKRLLEFLKARPAVGGVGVLSSLEGTLEAQEPLQIDSAAANAGKLHSFKEHWRWEGCNMSLQNNSLYEAPGNLFWLSMDPPTWNGAPLPATGLTYGQMAAGRQMWSDAKFIRSSEDPRQRHYFVQGSVPTAVRSMTDVPGQKAVGFVSLPCFGSRGVLAGWYSTADDALRAKDDSKVLKLYEAALSLPMRLRLGPSREQVSLDSISYSEDLFAARTLSSDSFFDYSQKVIDLFPPEPAFGGLTGRVVKEHAERLGLRFHGSPVSDNIQRALQNVAPYVQDANVRAAFKAFEDTSLALNDQTKLAMVMNATTKHFGKGSGAAVGACVQLLNALRYALVYKDVMKDSHLTKEFLVGGRNKAAPAFDLKVQRGLGLGGRVDVGV